MLRRDALRNDGRGEIKDMEKALKVLENRLVEVKQAKADALKKISKEYDPEINDLENALHRIKSICPVCDGSGVERFNDAAGSRDERACSECKGAGVRKRGAG